MGSNGHIDQTMPALSRAPTLKPPHRRLVLMFDGTGNRREQLSNVSRMFEALDDSTPDDYAVYSKVGADKTCHETAPVHPEEQPQQLLKYIKGVGTNFFGHLGGLGFGVGLSENVIEGYVWLSNNYLEGDEVFVFGFSRGAFSARSLVSLLHRCNGVLKNVPVTNQNNPPLKEKDPVIKQAYAMYMSYVQMNDVPGKDIKDSPAYRAFYNKWSVFQQTVTDKKLSIHKVNVKMVGVWDTVGAVGIPETGASWIDNHLPYGSKQYQFHDQGLSCIVENAYHALAIDEHRKHFLPTLWDQKTDKNIEVKQVWFTGSHCNVGGGADLDNLENPDDLWQYSYVWMQHHAQKHGLRFYWTYDSPATVKRDSQGKLMPSRRSNLRTVEDSYANFLSGNYKLAVSSVHRPMDETNGAKLHWSVRDRIVRAKPLGEKGGYFPESLFGSDGRNFSDIDQDLFQIDHMDRNKPELVTKRVWQIETDDADPEQPVKPLYTLNHGNCSCKDEIPKPKEQSRFWTLLGY